MDISAEAISQAKEMHPDIEFIEGDGLWLDFDSLSFDCVLIECALSLMSHPVEAIHEAYCVLKKGGYIIIHDLYLPSPSADDFEILEQVKASKREHAMQIKADHYDEKPRPEECNSCQNIEGSCPDNCSISQQQVESSCPDNCSIPQKQLESPCPDELISACTVDGALIMDDIFEALNELQLEKILFEDRRADLNSYVASMIFNNSGGNSDKRQSKSKMSYFLLIARKASK